MGSLVVAEKSQVSEESFGSQKHVLAVIWCVSWAEQRGCLQRNVVGGGLGHTANESSFGSRILARGMQMSRRSWSHQSSRYPSSLSRVMTGGSDQDSALAVG
jgi:hypothetical protein